MGIIKNLIVTICFIFQNCNHADEVQTDPTITEEYTVSTPFGNHSYADYGVTEEYSGSMPISTDTYADYDGTEEYSGFSPISNDTYADYDGTEEYSGFSTISNDTYADYDGLEEYSGFSPISHDTDEDLDFADDTQEENLTPEDIQEYLLQEDTLDFLSTFHPGYQRYVIRNQLKYCPYTSLCGFSFNLPQYYLTCCKSCSCDFPTCVKSKTCCPDMLFNHVNKFNSTSIMDEITKLLDEPKVQRDCLLLHLSNVASIAQDSAYGYAACPIGTVTGLHKNCTRSYNFDDISELTDTVPVINRGTNELYRNKYCAFCNGVSIDDLERLDVKLRCKEPTYLATDKDVLRAIYMEGKCDIVFPSKRSLEQCFTSISDCNITGTFEQTACSMYRSVLGTNGMHFQNIFCSLCNKIVPKSVSCLQDMHGGGSHFSFSGLLKLNERDGPERTYSSKTNTDKCTEDQLYDKILDTCKDRLCSEITVLKSGACVDVFEKLEEITYTTFLRIKPVNFLSVFDAYIVADHVIAHMEEFLEGSELCGMQMIYKPNVSLNETDLSIIESSNLLYFEARVRFTIVESHDPNKVVANIMKLHDSKQTFLLMNDTNETVIVKFQVRDDISQKFDAVSLLSQSHDTNNSSETSPEGYDLVLSPHLIASKYEGRCEFGKQYFNILEITVCPKVDISVFDVPWKEGGDGITFINSNYMLKSSEYYFIDENHIMICAYKYKQFLTQISHLKTGNFLSVESIMSIACSSISILALCFTFFIYCFFSKLRETIPGKNNMSLALALLFAQCLYLVGSFSGLERNSTECFIFGLLIHFSWLIALIWMNICTFHMFRVLTRTKVMSHTSGTRKLLIYHVYTLFMATIFVSINIGVSYVTNGDFGYGGETCYISSQRMVIYTFGIPAALVVLSNLLMFTFVIIKIKRSPSVQKNVRNERNDIIVFAKLSTITGATWVFGFLYMWTSVSALSYMFIVLNASQGVFIMFAFVVNRRVYDLFRGQVLGLTVTSFGSERPTSKTSLKMSGKS